MSGTGWNSKNGDHGWGYKGANINGMTGKDLTEQAAAAYAAVLSSADDNVISAGDEKQAVRAQWDLIAAENPRLVSQATALSVSHAAYDTASTTLANYLNGGTTFVSGVPLWVSDSQINVNTSVVKATFRANFTSYYQARTDLVNAMDAKAATLSSWAGVSGTGKPEDNATYGAPSGTFVGGTLAQVVEGNASTAFTGTTLYRSSGAPTNAPSPTSSTITANTVGGRDVRFDWGAYTQGANQADGLILFYTKGATPPTVNDASLKFNVNTSAGSYHIFQNVDMQEYYVGIAAFRRTNNGVEIGAIQTTASWHIAAGTANNTPSDGSVTPAKTNLAAINSSTGNLNSNVVTSATVLAGAIDQTKTNIAAISPSTGNIVAGQASVIAGFFGTLSAITANLGTVNAGSITGSANIDIAGSARFNGAYSIGGQIYAVAMNDSGGQGYGAYAKGYYGGIVAECSYLSGFAIQGTSSGTNATGVYGISTAAGSNGVGVAGYSSYTGTGVYGQANGSTGTGVYGYSNSGGVGVKGYSYSAQSVYGISSTADAGYFTSSGTAYLISAVKGIGTGSTTNGVLGVANSGGTGVGGSSSTGIGVEGISTSNYGGKFTTSSGVGVYGESQTNWGATFRGHNGPPGVYALGYGSSPGGYFESSAGTACYATSSTGYAYQANVTSGYCMVMNSTSGTCYYGSSGAGGTTASLYNTGGSGSALVAYTDGASAYGARIYNGGGGTALLVSGKMAIDNTTLVANLNADYLGGKHDNSFVTTIGTSSGNAHTNGASYMAFTSSVVNTATRITDASTFDVYSTSDARIKHDIHKEKLGLEFIKKLKPKTFRMNAAPERLVHGFIAQDVKKLIGNVGDVLYEEHSNGICGTDYVAIIAPLVKAVQELAKRIEELENDRNN